MTRHILRVTIVTVWGCFPKSPYSFSRKPNNREKGRNRHYCHSRTPVFGTFEGCSHDS